MLACILKHDTKLWKINFHGIGGIKYITGVINVNVVQGPSMKFIMSLFYHYHLIIFVMI